MRLSTLFVFIHLTTICGADKVENLAITEAYTRFKGEWRLAEVQNPGIHCLISEPDKWSKDALPDVLVKVTGNRFEMSGAGVEKNWLQPLEFGIAAAKTDNPYRNLKERGAKKLDDIVDVENQIVVFWFVGIYKLTDDKLHLALKYCGQGLEGKYFRDFRPPSSFDDEIMKDEVRLILKRVK